MNQINILAAGIYTTIQDLGRTRFQASGVPVGGAMDVLAMRTANALVGNELSAACLELTIGGTRLQLSSSDASGQWLAVCGADVQPTIDGMPIAMGRPVYAPAGSELRCQLARPERGARAYIAFAGGGLDVPLMLGSRSVYARGGKGRPLQAGDIIPICTKPQPPAYIFTHVAGANFAAVWHAPSIIRVFDVQDSRLVEHPFVIQPDSDRMGYRLRTANGEVLDHEPVTMLSEGVDVGVIQLPPSGEPIILMVERQTVGGYPRIGQVAKADIPRLAQMQPGQHVTFEEIHYPEAEQLYVEQGRQLERLEWSARNLFNHAWGNDNFRQKNPKL